MSSKRSTRPIFDNDRDFDAAFVTSTGLSEDALQAIRDAMNASGLTFVEAALHLGLLTQDDIEKAFTLALSSTGSQPGIVESALRRVSLSRQIVLRQGTEVEAQKELAPLLDPLNPRGEQLRALRTQLLLLFEPSRHATMIAVVSPCSGEGRSQLAAELALTFAQLGKRTLLIDADLRRPKLQSLFACHEESGLADAIAEDSTPSLHPVKGFPSLRFLAAGKIAQANPLELLSDNRFARMMEDWRRNQTFVVIDTPPLSEYPDAQAVATLAGNVLVLSRTEHTPFKSMRELMRRLAMTQSRVLGAVVNHF